MSKRLQVLLADREFSEIEGLTARERLTAAAWVRRALDEAKRRRAAEIAMIFVDSNIPMYLVGDRHLHDHDL